MSWENEGSLAFMMEKARATAVVGLGSSGGDFPTCWRALAASLALSSIVIIRCQPRGPRVGVTLGKMWCDIASIWYTRR
ncbi:uncharacterized protein BO66DRAFT_70916 [Aspergillus aculeatinus CBS 121060]|uniref:Uncharacterized protein n=1 Tax=Aspergillus aculeatinus CBS 121060 TaxID=1448322 RepID=A0ACD1HNS2_9EURO|nr:hypothetical protein BO66DRAFT_70916 [Aspergillus aculeatinus CBS 121060]RAH74998.1 hypothetical protein BO66DRAFT_70916 [Aspergillus aculeatinus CBS 121060]